MTATSFGPKKQPRFAAGDAPDLSGNPTEVADYAAKFGNYTEGATADRNTATSWAWEGLEFFDTTLKTKFVFRGGGWAHSTTPKVDAPAPVNGAAWANTGVLIIKAINVVVTSNGSGIVKFSWPGGSFPNGLLAFSPSVGDGAAFTGWVSNVASNRDGAEIVARGPGGVFAGSQMRVQGLAVGW